MRRRDWAGSILVACLFAAAALLRDHALLLLLLLVIALVCIAVMLSDVKRKPRPQPARLHIPRGRIPLHTARSVEVSEGEAQRIAASRDPRFAEYRQMPEAKRRKRDNQQALRTANELLGLIFQAEQQAPTDETLYFNLAARVETWAKGIGSSDEIQRVSGNPAADLTRLKVLVQTQLERLRDEQDGE